MPIQWPHKHTHFFPKKSRKETETNSPVSLFGSESICSQQEVA